MRREVLTWSDVDKLIDYLVPQIHGRFDSMIVVTRGGLVPGGMLAEALNITYIPTAEAWLCLAVVLDLLSRKMVGWAVAATMTT